MDIKQIITDAGVVVTDLIQTAADIEKVLQDAGLLNALTVEKLATAGPAPAPADTVVTIVTNEAHHTFTVNKVTGKLHGDVTELLPTSDGAINPANWAAFLAFLEQLLPILIPLI